MIFQQRLDSCPSIGQIVVPKVTGHLPELTLDITSWKFPTDVVLADGNFNVSNKVDILLGASLFWDVLLDGRIKLGKNLPYLQNTQFGYIVSGPVCSILIKNFSCDFSGTSKSSYDSDQLEKIWLVEEPVSKNLYSKDDEICEEMFKSSITRSANEQFIVKIPWN